MSKTLEIRVRPVTRHVVTRYDAEQSVAGRGSASSSTLGEFDNPRYADQAALAIQAREPHARVVTSDGTIHDPIQQQFVITKVNTFELQNEVYFASTEEEVASLLSGLSRGPDGLYWRAFSRAKNGLPVAPIGPINTTTYADCTTATGVTPLPVLSPAEQDLETEIQAKGLTAPRVTPADLQANISSEHYFTAEQGAEAAAPSYGDKYPQSLSLLTFCVLVLKNGFTVTGESACASPENFDAALGRKIARQNAEQKIWPLMGYALRSRLAGE